MLRLGRNVAFTLILILFLSLPAAVPDTLEFKVYREAYRDYFNVLSWMGGKLLSEFADGDSVMAAGQASAFGSESELVRRYLELNVQIISLTPPSSSRTKPVDLVQYNKLVGERDRLEPEVEVILRRQAEDVIREEGFTSSVGRAGIFPPLLFAFTPLPKVLVISPRDRISIDNTLALKPNLTWLEAEVIEERVSKLNNVSAIVMPIGGLGAYPTMIARTTSLEFLARTIPHEWAHNYLTLKPLGVRYTLQIEKDYMVVSMNESVATIMGNEIGDRVLEKYYGYPKRPPPAKPQPPTDSGQVQPPVESEFNRRMRTIRQQVDDYLAKGQVAEAEKYMEQEQFNLQAEGYDVRKLNQAYFAYCGSYAVSPGYTNHLGDNVAELRYRSPSLKAFVDTIDQMTSYDQLKRAVGVIDGN